MPPTAEDYALPTVPRYRSGVPSWRPRRPRTLRPSRRCGLARFGRFACADQGLATIEYIIGAAVVLGTLVVGVQAWNNGLVLRLQGLVTQMGAVR